MLITILERMFRKILTDDLVGDDSLQTPKEDGLEIHALGALYFSLEKYYWKL